jgi:hypothetical protein
MIKIPVSYKKRYWGYTFKNFQGKTVLEEIGKPLVVKHKPNGYDENKQKFGRAKYVENIYLEIEYCPTNGTTEREISESEFNRLSKYLEPKNSSDIVIRNGIVSTIDKIFEDHLKEHYTDFFDNHVKGEERKYNSECRNCNSEWAEVIEDGEGHFECEYCGAFVNSCYVEYSVMYDTPKLSRKYPSPEEAFILYKEEKYTERFNKEKKEFEEKIEDTKNDS